MKKSIACILVILVTLSLMLTFTPNVSGTSSNVEILDNYTFYEDSYGYLVVIGEVQNTGSAIIGNVTLIGGISTISTTASGVCIVWGSNLLPGQKAPFYMELSSEGSNSNPWDGLTKSDITIDIYMAPETNQYQYQGVSVVSSEATPKVNGEYWVTAQLQNNGSETAKGVTVIATFFNSEGLPIATGYIDPIESLTAGSSTTIKVPAWDLNQTIVPSDKKIVSYSLLVQVESPIKNDGNYPVISNNSTPTPGEATPLGASTTGTDSALVYVVLAIIVIVVLGVTILIIRHRKQKNVITAETSEPIQKTKKSRRQRRNK